MAKRTPLFVSLALLVLTSATLLRVAYGIGDTLADTVGLLPDDVATQDRLGTSGLATTTPGADAGSSRTPAPDSLPTVHRERESRACGGDIRLLASVVNTTSPRLSMAAVQLPGGTRLLRVGERLVDATFVDLDATRAYLRDADGEVCVLRVAPERAHPSPVAVSPRGRKLERAIHKPSLTAQDWAAGIRKLGSDSYAVSRELLERALGDPSALRRSGRFRIVKKDGRVEGLQLVAARPQSALVQLGVKKGDVVRNLNGLDLSNPGGALEAISMLKSRDRFSLAVMRGGSPRTLSYVVE
jgi:hypothetical protein